MAPTQPANIMYPGLAAGTPQRPLHTVYVVDKKVIKRLCFLATANSLCMVMQTSQGLIKCLRPYSGPRCINRDPRPTTLYFQHLHLLLLALIESLPCPVAELCSLLCYRLPCTPYSANTSRPAMGHEFCKLFVVVLRGVCAYRGALHLRRHTSALATLRRPLEMTWRVCLLTVA